jgi:hypothetical protein
VGSQVERLPEGAPVAARAEPSVFGTWYRRQRELRGISVFYVAARTKLTPERVREIEDCAASLETDGIGRATARSLALAIGADPDTAATLLGERQRTARGSRGVATFWLRGLLWTWGRRIGIALALGAALWLLGLWLSGFSARQGTPPLVYKPDYVDQLLKRY